MINQNEINIAKFCIEAALRQGASAARASLSKTIIDSYMMLNGELDKVTHSADRSIYLYIYAEYHIYMQKYVYIFTYIYM